MTQPALVFPVPKPAASDREHFTQSHDPAAIAERLLGAVGPEQGAAIGAELNALSQGRPASGSEVHRGVDLEAASSAPKGVDADRFALNQRVEAYMSEHGCSIDAAIRAVTFDQGGAPAPASVDTSRAELNRKVDAYLDAHPDTTMTDAIRAVSGASA